MKHYKFVFYFITSAPIIATIKIYNVKIKSSINAIKYNNFNVSNMSYIKNKFFVDLILRLECLTVVSILAHCTH